MTRCFVLVTVIALLALPAVAGAQMPDPSQMNGLSMPSQDLPNGTVSVRVIQGQLTNNLQGVPVDLIGAGEPRHAETGADGRAMFSGVPAGSTVHAVATFKGDRRESQPFEVPAQGGIRTILVFSDASGGTAQSAPPAAANPPAAGGTTSDAATLSIGGNSRVAAEFNDDTLQIFYLLEIVNPTKSPVSPATALVFDMPTGAEGTAVLEGSTRQANAKGPRVTVTGPFAPGVTPVQIGFRMQAFSRDLTLNTTFPLRMDLVAVAIQRLGGMSVKSPQLTRTTETSLSGQPFIVGTGPGIPAGTALSLQLSGLPAHDRTGEYVAIGLALAIVVLGVWLSIVPPGETADSSRRRTLETRRDEGLAALAALERDRASGSTASTRYEPRRAALMAQLERIYGELDGETGSTGGRDVHA
jgi:hypothetical protein